MTISPPGWLTARGGELRLSKDERSASVHFAGQLQYVLTPVPARGKHGCRISEADSGKRLDSSGVWDTPQAALQGGLEDLRARLGW
jgi:hypothetical protein